MARTSTYFNFAGNTEEAFLFYRSVFRTEFIGEIVRMGSTQPSLPEAEKNLVMHIALPITGGHVLMATDALESHGHKVDFGNNISLNLEPDTRAEADRLFAELSAGGKVNMPMQDMFWGAYWGSFVDRYGIYWMINCMEVKK